MRGGGREGRIQEYTQSLMFSHPPCPGPYGRLVLLMLTIYSPYPSDTTGPKDATKGIVVIFDIFGFFPQTLQGADILSTSDDHNKYQVFIPDWF
jgi:hypothetical protein